MKVLVTGGAGFIGGHLVDRLLREGHEVRVLDSLESRVHPDGRPEWLADVDFVRGSITDPAILLRALENVEIVFHQAAYQDYMPDFSRFLQVNAVGTALLYELILAHRLNVRKVILASSQAVYGEGQYSCSEHGSFLPVPRSAEQLQRAEWEVSCPRCSRPASPQLLVEQFTNPYNQYAVSKFAQEKAALGIGWLNGIPTVALRYSITQGARQSLFNHYSGICRIFFSAAMKGEPLTVYEDGYQTRDFVHVQDVVDANLLVLHKPEADFQAFNVGSGLRTTVLDYAKAVCRRVAGNAGYRIVGEYRRGDNRHSVSSVEKLTKMGWKPRRSLDDIFNDFLSWVDSIGGIPEKITDAYGAMRKAGVVLAVH